MPTPPKRNGSAPSLVRFAALAVVIASVAAGLLLTRANDPTGFGATPLELERPGRSEDLVCRLAEVLPGPPPRREAKLALACPDAGPDSTARVVPVGDDRRRAVVLRAGERLETHIETGGARVFRFWAATRGLGDQLDVCISVGDGADAARWERRLATHERWVAGEIPIPEDAPELALTIEATAPRGRDVDARLALAAPRLVHPTDPAEGGVPNIVLYVIDTLRADHTPMYGYHRNTMPHLNDLSADAIVFERAYSTAARTRPATASLLTGLYPSRHHARLGRGLGFHEETLAEKLREAGWSTWAYVANGNVFAPGFAFEQGFDHFQTVRGMRRDNHARTGEINQLMLPQLRERADEPFFLYVHAIDPHSPYDPPPEFAGTFQDPAYEGAVTPEKTHSRILAKTVSTPADAQHVRDLYDEDTLYQDAMLAELLDTLEELGVLDRTLLVVVADHGDEFQDHGGWEHGNRLFEEQIRVPLVVRVPGRGTAAGRRLSQRVSLADVSPTVLGLYGIDPPADAQGRDLSAVILDPTAEPPGEPIYAEEATNVPGGDLRTWIDGPWKLIRRASGNADDEDTTYDLFHLDADPGEQADLSTEEPERLARMRERLLHQSLELATPLDTDSVAPVVDERTKRQLRALGYLTGE